MTQVYDSSNHLKESEMPEGNYGCRLQDINAGSNCRNKGDADIGLLVACKVQLSSEVIRWKTESLRLQKERDSAQHRTKELDQTVLKLLERTKDLEMQLEGKKQLKTSSISAEGQTTSSIQRLSQSLNKCHSFSTSDCSVEPAMSRLLRRGIPDPQKHHEPLSEDWREVSQNMLKRMQLEMKELQEINSRLTDHPIKFHSDENLQLDLDCREKLEESISNLTSNAESLKHRLLDQRRKLHTLIRNFNEGHFCPKESVGRMKMDSTLIDTLPTSTNKMQHDYFSEQLQTLPDVNLDEDLTLHPYSCSGEHDVTHQAEEQKPTLVVEDRICPICEEQFGSAIPQAEFEEHVFDHLEAESASLLEQYVIL